MARQRKSYARKKGQSSRYQFKNWIYDSEGKRAGAEAIRPLRREDADLVSSAYYNPSSQTQTVYTLVWDLDSHRADSCWKDQDGRLDWGKMGNHLTENHPEIMKYAMAAIRSTGGKGIALMLAITPLEITKSTESCQRAARVLQLHILRLLNHYEMGADLGALGLVRDFPNWLNPHRVIDGDQEVLKFIQSEKNRPPVLTELLSYTSKLPFCCDYEKKKGSDSYLYPDLRSEAKLAILYEKLHTKFFDEDFSEVEMTTKEISELTGLSLPFLRKFLKTGTHWLESEWIDKRVGWLLRVAVSREMTDRAEALLTPGTSVEERRSIDCSEPLSKPEEVEDGERNEWITKAALMLKHNGIVEGRARYLLGSHVQRISGFKFSRNCRNVEKIISNLYRNKPEMFGCRENQDLENWIFEPLKPLSIKPSREKKITLQKGRSPGGYGSWSFGLKIDSGWVPEFKSG